MIKLVNIFWPILFIILIWFIFSSPYLLQHRVPFPSLYAASDFAPWDAYRVYKGPVKNAAMPDIITQIYPWRYFTIDSLKHGQIPLWNPYSFSGTPHVANYQSAVLSPLNLLFFIFSFVDAWSLLILLQPLLAGIFTYFYCRSLHISKIGSTISSIAFMFCGFITTWMGYGTLGYAIVFLPLALLAIEKYLQTNKVRYLFLLSISIPLSFFSGHFQISLYFFMFVVVYILYKAFSAKNILHTIYLILYTLFGLLLSMPQILPSLEFYNQSLRSNLFQQIEAIPLGYLPTLLSPDFFGNPVTRNDWFGHYAEWNGYIGLLPLMLGFYAIVKLISIAGAGLPVGRSFIEGGQPASKRYIKLEQFDKTKSNLVTFLAILSIFILFCAFDTPVLHFLIALHIPVVSTSAASRVIVLFSFCWAVLAGLGIDALLDDIKNKKFLLIGIWLGSFLLIFLVLWGIILLKLFLPFDKIAIAKQNLELPTVLLLISSGILITSILFNQLSKRFRKVFSANYIYVLLATCYVLFTSFDMLRFAAKWQPFDPKEFVFPPTPVTQNFTTKEPYQRLYGNNSSAEMSLYYHFPAVDGYDPLYIQRYGEFIASLDGKLRKSDRSVVSFPKDATYTPQAIKLLDIAYIIQKNSDNGKPWGFPFTQYSLSQFTPIYNDGSYTVYKNNVPTSHVFLAQNYQIETNAQVLLIDVFHQRNYRNTVILEKDPHIPQGGVSGNAHITAYSPNTITITAQTNHPAMLFLSEVFYPGWKAFIDGKETEIYRADYTFRSIVVPSGKHTIEFRYQPRSFTAGVWLAVVGIIGMVSFSFIHRRKLLQ